MKQKKMLKEKAFSKEKAVFSKVFFSKERLKKKAILSRKRCFFLNKKEAAFFLNGKVRWEANVIFFRVSSCQGS